MTSKARTEFELFKADDALRAARAVEVELTNANARLVAELDAERQARTETERAVAAMREALELLLAVQNGPPLLKYEREWNAAMEMGQRALSTPIGSGWLSPAEAAQRDARIAALEHAVLRVGCLNCRTLICKAVERALAPAAAHPTETP